ncbi:hypothetical protein EMIT043CA1_160093 [Pseudomonas brassicacearum]
MGTDASSGVFLRWLGGNIVAWCVAIDWDLYEKGSFDSLAGHTGSLHALSISDLARSKLDASGWR